MTQEARSFPRYAVEVAVEVSDGETLSTGSTGNLSRGGLCATVSDSFKLGALVTARLSLVFAGNTSSEPFELSARVVWSTNLADAGVQLGLSFLPLDSAQESYLDMFLRYLEEGRAYTEQP